jgi:hypothetical protein
MRFTSLTLSFLLAVASATTVVGRENQVVQSKLRRRQLAAKKNDPTQMLPKVNCLQAGKFPNL